jgi:hypothetical protein
MAATPPLTIGIENEQRLASMLRTKKRRFSSGSSAITEVFTDGT